MWIFPIKFNKQNRQIMHPEIEHNSTSSSHNKLKLSNEDATELKSIVSLLWGNSNPEVFTKVFLGGWYEIEKC